MTNDTIVNLLGGLACHFKGIKEKYSFLLKKNCTLFRAVANEPPQRTWVGTRGWRTSENEEVGQLFYSSLNLGLDLIHSEATMASKINNEPM